MYNESYYFRIVGLNTHYILPNVMPAQTHATQIQCATRSPGARAYRSDSFKGASFRRPSSAAGARNTAPNNHSGVFDPLRKGSWRLPLKSIIAGHSPFSPPRRKFNRACGVPAWNSISPPRSLGQIQSDIGARAAQINRTSPVLSPESIDTRGSSGPGQSASLSPEDPCNRPSKAHSVKAIAHRPPPAALQSPSFPGLPKINRHR